MPHWEFPATEPIDLDADITSGTVTINAKPTDTITVDIQPSGRHGDDHAAEVLVTFADGRLAIGEPTQRRNWLRFVSGLDVVVTLPTGSRCSVRTASAHVLVDGELGSLDARTVSGEISAGAITGDTEVSTTSGRMSIEDAAGPVSAKSASGAIDLGQVGGALNINTVSGRVEIGKAATSATVRTASGRVKIGNLSHGQTEIVTVSGEVLVHVAQGVGVYLDMVSISGRVWSELEPSEPSDQVDLRLQCRSISGAIKVSRAALAGVN